MAVVAVAGPETVRRSTDPGAANGSRGQNGHLPPPVPADKAIEDRIDEAASVGAHPLAEEHPAEQVIEVPDGGRGRPRRDD